VRVCYLSSMKNNKETFWNQVIAGLTAQSTEAEFNKQVAANVFAIRLVDCGGDAKRARKATTWLLSYDEDFWGEAEWEFRNKFGCNPSK
jgi:hypothetical protein